MSENIDYIEGPRGDTPSGAPHTADFRITGTCQLCCDWCWGPEHLRKGSITEAQITETIGRLAADGMEQVVFSGGEPTLSNILVPGVEAAKQNGLRVTLSTNWINIGKSRDLLHRVDDLGIPIDGSIPEINDAMRTRSLRFNAWQQAIGAIVLVQRMNSLEDTNIAITIRTVIARPNLGDAPKIPTALELNGVDIERLRFKLYQVEPFGPHYSHIDFHKDWAISESEAKEVAEHMRIESPRANITLQLYEGTVGRYFLVDPDGNATGTDEDERGAPSEVGYGNIVNDYDATLNSYRTHQDAIAIR
jgi:MoaA/NifB/PqqE/SkfB family radical SAM enzyme